MGFTGATTSWLVPVVAGGSSDEMCTSDRSAAHSIAQIGGFCTRGERLGRGVYIVQVKRFDPEQTVRMEPSGDGYIIWGEGVSWVSFQPSSPREGL